MSLIEECYASGRGELVDTIEAREEGGTTSHLYCSGWEDRVCTTEDGRTLTFIAMAMDLALPKNDNSSSAIAVSVQCTARTPRQP